jgi:hypothetical protein
MNADCALVVRFAKSLSALPLMFASQPDSQAAIPIGTLALLAVTFVKPSFGSLNSLAAGKFSRSIDDPSSVA